MSIAAAEDWEASGYIFDDDDNRYHRTTMLDNEGGLLRGSIDLTFDMTNIVFGRCIRPTNSTSQQQPDEPRYRFWTLPPTTSKTGHGEEEEEEGVYLKFRLVFWCDPSASCDSAAAGDEESNVYSRLEVSLLSEYPHSFPRELERKWLDWIQKAANQIMLEEQISYSVCIFIESHALDYFPRLLQDEENNITLVCFDDVGPAFYDIPTIVTTRTVKRLLPLQRHLPNGKYETHQDTSKLTGRGEKDMIIPLLVRWKEWLPTECPICFDVVGPKDAALLPSCNHGFCKSCLTTFLRIKADEISSDNPNNPFTCPLNKCRRGMKIFKFVKQFLSDDLMDKVRAWHKDIKTPPCYSLPGCLKRDCKGMVLRKDAVDSFYISCEVCMGRWCELCLQRAPIGKPHEDTPACKVEMCQQFCERYLAAGDKAKAACEEKFPWIKLYANSKVHDQTILLWIQNNGQVCPGCKTGIERSDGCFHMSCACGTHFCYECGEEIFYPYYGTHHCWERVQAQAGEFLAQAQAGEDFFRIY